MAQTRYRELSRLMPSEFTQTWEQLKLSFIGELVIGEFQIVACRGFVEFVRRNRTALQLIEWSKPFHSPDEIVFPTINHNAQYFRAPGSYTGNKSADLEYGYISRFKHWINTYLPTGTLDNRT